MAQAPVFRRPGQDAYLTFEEFLALPEPERAEWVDGRLVAMPGVTREHAQITTYLIRLLGAFLDEHAVGEILHDPFLMRLGDGQPARAPDLMFVAEVHASRLRDNYLDGPADISIEVISPGSRGTDRGDKYAEYEAAGVTEYWLFDPERRVAEFYRLANGRYELAPIVDGIFRSEVLPGFWLRVEWLWERPALSAATAELGLR